MTQPIQPDPQVVLDFFTTRIGVVTRELAENFAALQQVHHQKLAAEARVAELEQLLQLLQSPVVADEDLFPAEAPPA